MRALFLLLVLANLMFFGYAQVVSEGAGIGSRIAALQISPDRIRLLRSGGGPAAEAAKQATQSIPPVLAPKAPVVCLEWSNLGGPDVARAENDLQKLGVKPSRIERKGRCTALPFAARSLHRIQRIEFARSPPGVPSRIVL